jgi:hypothetical protein
VAEGTIDFLPELEPLAEAILPLGVTITHREPYGGAIRMTIQGDDLEAGTQYQVVATSEPFRRCYELKPGGPVA